MRVIIALKLCDQVPEVDGDYIGCDAGALFLASRGIHMKAAIGDFDSVEAEDLDLIRKYSDQVIALNPIKDDSDSEAAINLALSIGYDEIWMSGATGGRLDHEYINLRLLYRYHDVLHLIDRQNLIYAVSAGDYMIKPEGYQYISFFTQDTATITLQGFAYPLDHRTITYQDLYTVSNEITAEEGRLIVHEGIILIMKTKDRK